MESGLVYVVHNDCIQSSKAKDGCKTYKIGITKGSVIDRYLGLSLIMPGEFVCDFSYTFDNGKYREVETELQKRLIQTNVNGEWFDLNDEGLEVVHSECKACGGVLNTDDVQKQIKEDSGIPPGCTPEQWAGKSPWQKAAAKAHATRKRNEQKKHEKQSQTAKKAWVTRRKNDAQKKADGT